VAVDIKRKPTRQIELLSEEEGTVMENVKRGKKIVSSFPKWALLEVTLRGRKLIWVIGKLTSKADNARIFKVRFQDIFL
jgi:hypothetical protein